VDNQHRPPWEREDLSPRQCAVATIEYHRSQGNEDLDFLRDEVIRVLSEHLARDFAAGCRRQLERADGDIESILRFPPDSTTLDRRIDESLAQLDSHVLSMFRRYGVEIPEGYLLQASEFFDWHEELRSSRFPEVWKAWGFQEPTGREGEKAVSNLALACEYAKWIQVLAAEVRRSLEVTWKLWTGPLGYGEVVSALSETLALLADIRPEHALDGFKSHRAGEHGELGATFGRRGGSPPDPLKAALVAEIHRRLQIEEKTAEELFYDLDGGHLEVKDDGKGDGEIVNCPVTCDHASSELIVEGLEFDKRVSLRTFERYVTEAKRLARPQ
jgi:hypothetical protein